MKQRLEPNGELDHYVKKLCFALAKVLAGEDGHGLIEHPHVVEAALLGAFALVVDDLCLREIVVLVTRLDDAVAQIDVLAIHEEGLVQQADLIQHGFPE